MIDIEKLNIYTQIILMKSGWYEGRKYDCNEWIHALVSEGFSTNSYALEILGELGNIYVRARSNKYHTAATFNFNPFNAASGECDRIDRYQKACKESLFPLGECFDFIIYAGGSRKIYAASWCSLDIVGDCIEDYLNNVFQIGYTAINVPLDY